MAERVNAMPSILYCILAARDVHVAIVVFMHAVPTVVCRLHIVFGESQSKFDFLQARHVIGDCILKRGGGFRLLSLVIGAWITGRSSLAP